ncbi:MAG: TraR/DksA C4-type zinc finger protein [Gammaproteobacteria bacterium]|nr:TraR/DksA C4-type zinc finger protein [Gammaproteobacteria bacterium]
MMDLEHFRQRLRNRLAELEALASGSGTDGEVVTLDQQRVGRLSRMDAMQAREMAGATRRRREQEHRRVLAALARIEADEFGYCVECDAPIPEGRLEIDPSAALCVNCAAAAG